MGSPLQQTPNDALAAAAKPAGLIFPQVPALVSRDPERGLEIANFATNDTAVVDGLFEAEVRDFLGTGAMGALLQALPPDHPLPEMLAQLGSGVGLPLSPETALRLERFDTLFLELTGACTARCDHCYAEAHPEVDSALDLPTCEAVLREARRLGFRRVQLTGGEPLLCTFLPELVRLTSELGLPTCEIFTNGMLLDDALLQRLAPHRPDFAFSFYSHRPEIHDGITQTPGSHALTCAAIRRCVALGLETRVAIIVMQQNSDHVAQTMRYLRELGVSSVSAGSSYGVGRGRPFHGDFELAAEVSQDQGKCSDHHGKLCVAHDGTVYPCIFNRSTPLGRLSERPLRQIVASPALPPADALDAETFLQQTNETLACVECRLTAFALRRLARMR
jgi:MoaA/NifB/PqqE/SkfB family radical SAM enzyme